MAHKYLLLDTETTGLFRYDMPAHAEGQPRMASISMVALDSDGAVEGRADYYIKPEGWVMPPAVQRVHGLSTGFLHANGVPLAKALDLYEKAIKVQRRVVVAYNARFDLKVLRGELRRAGRDDLFAMTYSIDLMWPMTPICKLPKARGGGHKLPKLSEALKHLGVEHVGAHTGAGDVNGAIAIFHYLRAQGLLPAPAVHKAKPKEGDAA